MIGLEVNSHGDPVEIISVKEVELQNMESDQVTVELIASPINPSDILQIQGLYPSQRKLPSIFGTEGIGTVVDIGSDVKNVKSGDTILLPLGSKTWKEKFVISSKGLFPLPSADPLQLAMIGINPPTAYAMLTEFVDLKEGDWIVQNAANSAVGRYVIILAKMLGFKTVNIVRRESLIAELKEIGADVVVVNGPELISQARNEVGDGHIKLAFDAIAGQATNTLAQLLTKKGVIVAYGALSLEFIQVNMGLMMSKNLKLMTFWLTHWLQNSPVDKIQNTYQELIKMIASGE
ncbi:MAG: zinc-dependent alcohol dehydrogenase family protein, partial [Candidatus Kariarchaeaceae archaeon]